LPKTDKNLTSRTCKDFLQIHEEKKRILKRMRKGQKQTIDRNLQAYEERFLNSSAA
jgi:hypothetical protein